MSEPEPSNAPFYVTGGTLKPGAPSYVERRADTELLESLLAGEFCYVLTARQMGKSSLMARTAKRLEQDGTRTAIVDLSQIGTERGDQAASQWYFGIAHLIHRQLRITEPLRPWWQERADLPPVQRLTDFFRELVLEHCPGRVVIFVDEIDSTIGLPFADDFFAALRACFNARATDAAFERLTFALFGVASPDQLIQDQARTPFNIGKRIDLTDFTLEEAAKLSEGLHADPTEASKRLERILHWTGGHPYLTQAVCRTVRERGGNSGTIEEVVDPRVEDLFLSSRAQREETNLKHARARLEQPGPEKRRLLRLYLRVRQGKAVPDQPASSLFSQLKLAGVVKATDAGQLAVRNRIYERVFTPQWVKSAMPVDRGRQLAAATLATSLIAALVWYAVFQPRDAEQLFQAAIQDDAYTVASQAYSDLRANPFSRSRAADLMQRFWEQRGLKFAKDGERDQALLSYLQAMSLRDSEGLRRRAQNLVGSDYERLRLSLRHKSPLTVVAFSHDGRTILTASEDHTSWFWNARSGKLIYPPSKHKYVVYDVAFSPDRFVALTGSKEYNSVQVWDAQFRDPLSPLLRHQAPVSAVDFSPDGDAVVTGSFDRVVRVWDARSGDLLSPPLQHQDVVSAVAFSPDGRSVVTGFFDGTVRVWDVRSGNPLSPLLQHRDAVSAMAFGPDGNAVVIGSFSGIVRVWDARSGSPLSPPLWHGGDVTAVVFSPDGSTVVTGSKDSTARVWDVRSGNPLSPPLQHGAPVSAVAISPDGDAIMTGSLDGTVRVWDARFGNPFSPSLLYEGAVFVVAISPDGDTIVAGSFDGTMRVWDARSGNPLSPPLQNEGTVSVVAFSPDGNAIVTGSRDNTAQVWDARSGNPLSPPLRHENNVFAVALSPDGRTVVTGAADGTARVWDARSGDLLSRLLGHETAITAVAFSPDGRIVVTGSTDNTARVWNTRSGGPISTPLQHKDIVTAVAFSPDGRVIVTATFDGTVQVWDALSGKPISQPLEHGGYPFTVAFSPDGKSFLVATSDWLSTYLWDGKDAAFQNSQFLKGVWKGAFRFPSDCQNCLQVALGDTGNSLRIETLRLDEPSDPPIQGDPQELLKKWQERLGLRFDEKRNLFPR